MLVLVLMNADMFRKSFGSTVDNGAKLGGFSLFSAAHRSEVDDDGSGTGCEESPVADAGIAGAVLLTIAAAADWACANASGFCRATD